jgi:hypothetical protein
VTVSGSTNYTLTANEIIDKAFHRLGKGSEGEAISARMYEDGRSSLNLLLKSKLGTTDRLFLRTTGSVTLLTDTASYAQASALRMLSVRRRDSDNLDTLADDLETEYPVNDSRLALKIERKARII